MSRLAIIPGRREALRAAIATAAASCLAFAAFAPVLAGSLAVPDRAPRTSAQAPESATVTFMKLVCPAYSDVPANQNPQNQDATGGHWAELNTHDQTVLVSPATDVPAACHPQAGWQFRVWNGNATGALNSPAAVQPGATGSDGTSTYVLSPDQVAEASTSGWATGVLVTEQPQPSVASFGALRCYRDIMNGDNLESIYGLVATDTQLYCIAYGVAPEPSPSPSPTPDPSATPSPSPEPSASPSESPSASPTPSPSTEPSPTPSPSAEPSATPSPIPTPTPSPSPTPTASAPPSAAPPPDPFPGPSSSPSSSPSIGPVAILPPGPSPSPSSAPSARPSPQPSPIPTASTSAGPPQAGAGSGATSGASDDSGGPTTGSSSVIRPGPRRPGSAAPGGLSGAGTSGPSGGAAGAGGPGSAAGPSAPGVSPGGLAISVVDGMLAEGGPTTAGETPPGPTSRADGGPIPAGGYGASLEAATLLSGVSAICAVPGRSPSTQPIIEARPPGSSGLAAVAILGGLHLGSSGLPAPGSDEWVAAMLRNGIVSSATATVMAMALFSLGRKRRDEEVEATGAHGCDGSDAGAPHFDGRGQAVSLDLAVAFIPPEEASLPRWRRPSLMAARKAAPIVTTDEAEASRLTFSGAPVSADPQHEYRRLRYRMVRLSDGPDEIRSMEIGRLDQGDEVELLESYGAYWKVRIPTGQVGWIHRMTLGESVAPAAEDTRSATFVGASAAGAQGDPASFRAPPSALANNAYMARLAAAAASSSADAGDFGGEGLAARLIRERSH